MYRPEHDIGLQRANAKAEKKAEDAKNNEQKNDKHNVSDGLPA